MGGTSGQGERMGNSGVNLSIPCMGLLGAPSGLGLAVVNSHHAAPGSTFGFSVGSCVACHAGAERRESMNASA